MYLFPIETHSPSFQKIIDRVVIRVKENNVLAYCEKNNLSFLDEIWKIYQEESQKIT